MIQQYFHLQYRMINRRLKEFGLNSFIAFLLLLVVFAGISMFVFSRIAFAEYIYILTAMYFLFNLSNPKRNDFLKTCFSDKDFKTIRILENVLITGPFLAFLVYRQCFSTAAILSVFTVVAAVIDIKTRFYFVIPTPFSKKPFEFTVGFRQTFYLFILAYALAIIAIAVDNFNLGAFALISIMLIIWSFYLKPENIFYVWQFALSPQKFLFEKIKTAFVYSLISVLPIILILSPFYPENIPVLLLCFLSGFAFLLLLIFIKYADFPEEMNIFGAVQLALCLTFPPLLLVLIPYFFNQSVKQLNCILK